MALPHGWDETPNEWRYRLRDPRRFLRIRPKRLAGVKGVYLMGGPLKGTDPEKGEHGRGSYVEQAIRFDKWEWTFPAALGWQQTHYHRRRQNPRRGKYAILTVPEQHQLRIAKQTLQLSDAGARILGGMTKAEARAIVRRYLGEKAIAFYDAPPLENPRQREHAPAEERAQAAAMATIHRLVDRQGELSAAIAQVREKVDRGVLPEPWEFDRLEGAKQAIERAQADVQQAVERHGAVIEEFHVAPIARRRNPARGGAAEARRLYREFHGAEPANAKLRKIPDLDRLVHLGNALEVHYRAAVSRGEKNTPYRHEFGPGAELMAPPGGGALVILGNAIKVSRAPRGRLGYIRG